MILLSILIFFIYRDLLFFTPILMLTIYEIILPAEIRSISGVLVIAVLGCICFPANSSRFSDFIGIRLVIALLCVYDYFILIGVIFFSFFVRIRNPCFFSDLLTNSSIDLFISIVHLTDFMTVFMLICSIDILYMIFDNVMLAEMAVTVIMLEWTAS